MGQARPLFAYFCFCQTTFCRKTDDYGMILTPIVRVEFEQAYQKFNDPPRLF